MKFMNDNDLFAKRLRRLRKAAGLTQSQVADKLSMTRSGYSQYECPRREPSIVTLVMLANLFNVSLDWLCGRDKFVRSRQTEDDLNETDEL